MEKKKFDHKVIEAKWQKYWKDNKTFEVSEDSKKPKYYVLDMFPYPSGAGLHVGHVTGYTGSDIMARYFRQLGYNVLHPMGWDSFGLPAEQYAIRTGTHPEITTKENINTYRRQLQSLGFSYDWSREFATSDPDYYKWTQWFFTKLFELDLAYEAEVSVNYCPHLGTVLANEEVANGKSKEGGFDVIRKPLKQWILKITKYADRLIEDLEEVDWPENIKRLQINWIGKSEGANVDFTEEKLQKNIKVFTTRPDTLFGATYLVLAPEHPYALEMTTDENKKEVEKYIKKSSLKSDLERTDLAKEKTGVFTGSFAINPVNGKKIPIWISDYVLINYGTGAIMAVPAHDERDFEFATKFNLPIKCVFEPNLNDIEDDDKESFKQQVLVGKICWPKDGIVINSENEKISINGKNSNEAIIEIIKFLENLKKGEKTTSYKLRDWLFSRQRYWGEPFPILTFEDGTKRVLDVDELPLTPPPMKDYRPDKNSLSPLSKVKDWVNIKDSKTNKMATREINTMPQWAGSCWYYLRFCDPKNEKFAFSKSSENYWMPVDLYVGGAEHAVLHLLYARFWHKVFYDLKLVHTKEPFKKFRCQGVVTAPAFKMDEGGYVSPEDVFEEDGKFLDKKNNKIVNVKVEKMSKSKLNGVTPDNIVDEFGADALRLYEMFMGPFDREKVWNTDAVSGCYRFLNRFYDLSRPNKITKEDLEKSIKPASKLLFTVKNEIKNMQFNTAIAHLMEFVNEVSKLDKISIKAMKMATQALYPLAPHIAEEIWHDLGEKDSISISPFIEIDEKFLKDDMTTYVIQVNGKRRASFDLEKGKTKEEIYEIAKSNEIVKKYLTENILKIIFVPERLLNIVVK